jgi:glycosyltransferase involved in cell wall biosynthesis
MLTKKLKVLFLYTEIAEYFVAACRALAQNAEVYIIRWPVNSEAPFEFKVPQGVHIIDRNQYDTKALNKKVKEIQPNVIFCSGWIDKGYLKVVKEFSGQIPTVLSMDNHWKGTPKQQIGSLVAQYTFLKDFDFAWVPGAKQVDYAKRLGFSDNQIFTGYYTANVERFNAVYEKSKHAKIEDYPKSFLYVGRYIKHKGVFDLWEAFKNYRNSGGSWNLICAGTGDQWENRIEFEGISHLGFIQPEELSNLIERSGAYILPSHFEPWGVSVHEMACAGLPLILSKEIGSKDMFLAEGENGYSFENKNIVQLTNAMLAIDKLSEVELIDMGIKSSFLGNQLNTENWVQTVLEILNFRT